MAARKFSRALSVIISIVIIAEIFSVSMTYSIVSLNISVKAANADIPPETSPLSRADTQKEKLLLCRHDSMNVSGSENNEII